jgi:hypothetical protein
VSSSLQIPIGWSCLFLCVFACWECCSHPCLHIIIPKLQKVPRDLEFEVYSERQIQFWFMLIECNSCCAHHTIDILKHYWYYKTSNCKDINFYLKFKYTSMLVPGDPGSTGIHIYVFTVESQQPMGARHTSCMQLLWKPHGPSREDTPIYLVTFETSRLVGPGNTSCTQLLCEPRNRSRQGTHI